MKYTLQVHTNTFIKDSSRLKIEVHERMQQYCRDMVCACTGTIYFSKDIKNMNPYVRNNYLFR